MYLAQKTINRRTHYFIRNTYADGPHLKSRDVFDLGTDPSKYIIYPGGNAYYFHEEIQDALRQKGLSVTQDDLDDIFRPFLRPDIKRIITDFQPPVRKSAPDPQKIPPHVHLFDKSG